MTNIGKVLAVAGVMLAGPAFAATVAFESADANGDGAVTMDEAKSVMPDLTEDRFAAADSDANGSLSPAEFQALDG